MYTTQLYTSIVSTDLYTNGNLQHTLKRTHQYSHWANSCGNTISHPAKDGLNGFHSHPGFKTVFFSGRWTWAGHQKKAEVYLSFGWTPPQPLEVVNLLIAGQTHTTDLTRKTVFWMGLFSVSPFLFPFCIPNFSLDWWVLENPNWRRVSSYLHITHWSLYNPGFLSFH